MTIESRIKGTQGWLALAGVIGLFVVGTTFVWFSASKGMETISFLLGCGMIVLSVFALFGFYTLQPNEAAVFLFFGRYHGSVRNEGLLWANPLFTKYKYSLRARNFNSEKLKVNDKSGNPIEIVAVVVWCIHDTARAKFDVDDYAQFVTLQTETSIRHVASSFPYESAESELSLRKSTKEVSETLQRELQERLDQAGVRVLETRLTHLAYAPEIAQAMLRRQQAEAVLAARQIIVHGAVSMVDMALKELSEKHVITLDEDRKAAMVSNLLVILCGEAEVQPVINAGTLYT